MTAHASLLEPLTKPAYCPETYDDCGDDAECAVEIGVSFVSNGQASETVDPREGAFNHPAMFAELGRTFDATPCDARHDAPLAQVPPAAVEVIPLVGMELAGAFTRSPALAADRRDGIDDIGQRHAVVPVGPCQDNGERNTGPVDHDMALGARPATIRRVRTDRIAPFLAATEEESTEARDQSISPAR